MILWEVKREAPFFGLLLFWLTNVLLGERNLTFRHKNFLSLEILELLSFLNLLLESKTAWRDGSAV